MKKVAIGFWKEVPYLWYKNQIRIHITHRQLTNDKYFIIPHTCPCLANQRAKCIAKIIPLNSFALFIQPLLLFLYSANNKFNYFHCLREPFVFFTVKNNPSIFHFNLVNVCDKKYWKINSFAIEIPVSSKKLWSLMLTSSSNILQILRNVRLNLTTQKKYLKWFGLWLETVFKTQSTFQLFPRKNQRCIIKMISIMNLRENWTVSESY